MCQSGLKFSKNVFVCVQAFATDLFFLLLAHASLPSQTLYLTGN